MEGRAIRLLASASLVGLLAACAVTPTPFSQADLDQQAKVDRTAMFADQERLEKPLTLADAMARVLRYNLDRRAKMMEETLALGQLDLDSYDLLPKLAVNAGYTGRSEANATRSRDLYTQTTSTSNPTYSADRDAITADLSMTWNVLDFGVSYYTAQQNADRALITTERRRKTVANLASEVRFTFWRAAAAQSLYNRVNAVIADAEKALGSAERVESERLRNPADSLRTQKTLLESIRQLEAINQELSSAKAELSALINIAPGTNYTLDIEDSGSLPPPEWNIPIERMEELALSNNPDLREQNYLARIGVDETRKEILKLLPGITFSLSRQYDSNSFLMANRWNEAGAKLTWNLLNLLSAPDRIAYAETRESVDKAKRLALRMAVLAQVHVVAFQFDSAVKQFRRVEKLWKVEKRLAETTARQQQGGTQNDIDRVTQETSEIAAELRRYQGYAQLQATYGKLQATLGIDPLPPQVASHDLRQMAHEIDLHMRSMERKVETLAAVPPPPMVLPASATAADMARAAGIAP